MLPKCSEVIQRDKTESHCFKKCFPLSSSRTTNQIALQYEVTLEALAAMCSEYCISFAEQCTLSELTVVISRAFWYEYIPLQTVRKWEMLRCTWYRCWHFTLVYWTVAVNHSRMSVPVLWKLFVSKNLCCATNEKMHDMVCYIHPTHCKVYWCSTLWQHLLVSFLGLRTLSQECKVQCSASTIEGLHVKGQRNFISLFHQLTLLIHSAMHIMSFSGGNRALCTWENSDLMIKHSSRKEKKKKELPFSVWKNWSGWLPEATTMRWVSTSYFCWKASKWSLFPHSHKRMLHVERCDGIFREIVYADVVNSKFLMYITTDIYCKKN